jgi:hypothetical protein
MGVTTLKTDIAAMFSSLDDIGTIDQERLDHDDLPRALNTQAKTLPYWSLSLAGMVDTNLAVGRGNSTRQIRRTYQLRLEGWRGITGTAQVWTTWETLVESVLNRLQLRQGTASPDQVMEMRNLRATPLDIVRLGTGNGRAHHVLITADVDCQVTLTA